MRKVVFYILTIGVIAFFSCSHEILCPREGVPAWETQLETVRNRSVSVTRSSSFTGLTLKDYAFKGTIKSEKDLQKAVEKIFNDEAEFAFEDEGRIVFAKIKDIKVPATEEELKENNVLNFIKVGMSLVELYWEYEGMPHTSLAVVSDRDGVIYDNIGTRVPAPVEMLNDIPDSLGEVGGVPVDTLAVDDDTSAIVTRSFECSDSRSTILGHLYSYEISVTSMFDGSSVLVGKDIQYYSRGSFGYKCEAVAKTDHGTEFQHKFHDFSWAYAYGSAVSFTIKAEEVGFTITGGGTHGGGSHTHTRERE